MKLQKFTVTIHGESAHGSQPHLGKDAIVAAASCVTNLQGLVSRVNNPLNPLVLSICSVKAGSQFNIITDKAVLNGVLAGASEAACEAMHDKMAEIIKSSAASFGCTADVEYGAFKSEEGVQQDEY